MGQRRSVCTCVPPISVCRVSLAARSMQNRIQSKFVHGSKGQCDPVCPNPSINMEAIEAPLRSM